MLFGEGNRKRARPSLPGLGLSLMILVVTVYLALIRFFLYLAYIPLLIALGISLVVFLFRARNLNAWMPEPYGRGRASKVDSKSAMRLGVIFSLGGGLSIIGLMASVFFLPPELFLGLFFGVTAGLPLSQVLFFVLVAWYERRSGMRIFYLSAETSEGDETVLVKSIELS